MNRTKNVRKATAFSVVGIAFIILGFIFNDTRQIYFGVIWLIIAVAAIIIGKKKTK